MKKVKCFHEEFNPHEPYAVMDGGLRTIETRMITGTVDKCGELDARFRYLKRGNLKERFRRGQMMKAAKHFALFPPINVYRYKNEYFVVDGNRRVATAKEMGVEYIDAYITEYIPENDRELLDGALLRRRFESETGIKNIVLTKEMGFEQLLKEVYAYPEGEKAEEKAMLWKSNWFLPGCAAIEHSSLPRYYKNLRTEDMYVLVSGFYSDFMGGYPEEISFDTIISGYLFARRIKNRRLLRFFLFRIFDFFLMGKQERGY
jgi:hypothetical protein